MVANQFCKTGWLSVDLERAAINQATSLEGARPTLGGGIVRLASLICLAHSNHITQTHKRSAK